jgi:hypothetical protein
MTIIRQTPDFQTLPATGKAVELKQPQYLACQVAIEIDAPPEKVMGVLKRGNYSRWNSTLTKFEGDVEQGRTLKLVSVLAPQRTFKLKVSELGADTMVWEDGMPFGLFRGVRSFRASRTAKGTTVFAMSEIFSGAMLGLIAKSLPDQRATFEAFAHDLKNEVERN